TIQVIHPIVHANFFFNTFHIHPPQLEPIALYSSALLLFVLDVKTIKQYKNIVIFIAPFWILMLMIYFKWNFQDIFWWIEKEDSLTEYLTFATYLFVTYLSFQCVRLIKKMKIRSNP